MIERGALLSECRRYRYHLWRPAGDGDKRCVFVGINPSTADEVDDDPTIRKCVGFARRWGFGAIDMVNLFAWRSTDQNGLLKAPDPIGPKNDETLADVFGRADRIVWAWGNGKSAGVRRLIGDRMRRGHLYVFAIKKSCQVGNLGLTGEGAPKHPLMLGYKTKFVPTTNSR